MSEKDPSQGWGNAHGKLQPVHAKTFEIFRWNGQTREEHNYSQNLGNPVIIREVETIIINLPTKQTPDQLNHQLILPPIKEQACPMNLAEFSHRLYRQPAYKANWTLKRWRGAEFRREITGWNFSWVQSGSDKQNKSQRNPPHTQDDPRHWVYLFRGAVSHSHLPHYPKERMCMGLFPYREWPEIAQGLCARFSSAKS